MTTSVNFGDLPTNVSTTALTDFEKEYSLLESSFKEALRVLEENYYTLTAAELQTIYDIVERVK